MNRACGSKCPNSSALLSCSGGSFKKAWGVRCHLRARAQISSSHTRIQRYNKDVGMRRADICSHAVYCASAYARHMLRCDMFSPGGVLHACLHAEQQRA